MAMDNLEEAREILAAWKRADEDLPPKGQEVLIWNRELLAAHVAEEIAARKQAERERDESRAWVDRMIQETQELRCASCGEPYSPGTLSVRRAN